MGKDWATSSAEDQDRSAWTFPSERAGRAIRDGSTGFSDGEEGVLVSAARGAYSFRVSIRPQSGASRQRGSEPENTWALTRSLTRTRTRTLTRPSTLSLKSDSYSRPDPHIRPPCPNLTLILCLPSASDQCSRLTFSLADTRPSSSAPKNLAEFITRQQQKLPAGSGTGAGTSSGADAGSAPAGVGVGVATPAPVLPRFINDFPSPWRSDQSLSPDQPHPPTQAHATTQSLPLPPGQPLPQIPPQQVFPAQLPTLPHDPMVGPSRIPAGPSAMGIGIGPTHPFVLGSNSQPHYPLDPTGLPTFPLDNPHSQSFSLPSNAAGALPFDNTHRDLDPNANPNPNSNPNSNPNLNLDSFSPFASMDPTELILALSSQLPTIEEGFPFDDRSPAGSSNQGSTAARRGGDGESPGTGNATGAGGNGGSGQAERHKGKIYKVTWWRPHGKTAIAPGEWLPDLPGDDLPRDFAGCFSGPLSPGPLPFYSFDLCGQAEVLD